ncbi:MAG: class I SAM-dependent methyltransferase [Actinobacteria bacterium]|nr:class I SAM-dependent methyltransferase [Actinomycetota bacterium]
MVTDSIDFDRAAGYYDRTRGLPPDVIAAIVGVLAPELSGREPCLEIGVGTGRIALPLHDAGVAMAGVDLAAAMLGELLGKSGGAPPFPLALADATRLPLRDDSIGSGLCVHVLHLIPAWRHAVAELARVIRPGGVVLIDIGGTSSGDFGAIHARFCKEAELIQDSHPGANTIAEVDEAMAAHGAGARELPVVSGTGRDTTYEAVIRSFEDGIFSWTWSLDDGARKSAGAAVRTWARERFGALDRPLEHELAISFRAYDLP